MSACEQAPVSQFGSSAHGSLLCTNFQSCGEIESTHEFKFLKKQSEDVSKVTINSPRVTGLITGSANLDMVVYDTWYLWRSGKYLGMR